MNKFNLIFILILIIRNDLYSELEEIQLNWNAIACLETCIPLLERNLRAITPGRDLQINGHQGVARMSWNPDYPFSYEPFRAAFAATGILVREMRVRVRGTIRHDMNNFYLHSTGDGALYVLLGPLNPEPGRYVPKYNIVSYPLSLRLKEELLDAEKNQYTVIISGPLFMPEKYPRTLISEKVQVNTKRS